MPPESNPLGALTDGLTPKRAVIYLRVSTSEQATKGGQAEGFSIPAQREANKKKAQSMGAIVTKEFVERGVSGTTINRPALKEMVKYLEEHRGQIDYVIVHKIDRLARNRTDDVAINEKFDQLGVRLVSTSENIDQSPGGMLMHGIMSSIAEFYSKNLANEVTKGMDSKAKMGGTPGKAPTGYLNVRKYNQGVETRTVEVDPDRAPHVQWAFERYVQGDISVSRLTALLENRGLTSAPLRNTPPRPLSRGRVHSMLKNPYYIGTVTYKGVQYPGVHEPLIDESTFLKVQDVLSGRRQGERTRKHHHYLKSTLWCGECGSRLILQVPKSRSGDYYHYFVCNGRLSKRSTCTMPAVPVEFCEKAVQELYRRIEIPDELMATLREKTKVALSEFARSELSEQRRLANELEALENKQQKLFDLYYDDAISAKAMAEQQKAIETGLTRVRAAIARETKIEKDRAGLIDVAMNMAANCHQLYRRTTEAENASSTPCSSTKCSFTTATMNSTMLIPTLILGQ